MLSCIYANRHDHNISTMLCCTEDSGVLIGRLEWLGKQEGGCASQHLAVGFRNEEFRKSLSIWRHKAQSTRQ